MTTNAIVQRIGAGLGLALLLAQNVFAQPPNGGPELAQKVANAKPGELRVMVTAAILGPLQAVRAQAEKAVGRPLVIEYGSARGNLQKAILAGQPFEVAILLPDVNKELLAHGKILPQGGRVIAHAPVAISLRGDGPAPDVSTPEALKKALLGAKAVKYAPPGAARDTVDKVLNTLGIADSIKDASKTDPHGEPPLAPGEYELNFYPLSEILPNRKVRNLGLVPAPLQVPAAMEAVIGTQASDRQAAEAFINFLAGPTIDAALSESGMTK